MAIKYCYLCNQDPVAKRQYGGVGLADGTDCPVCYQPTCRLHLTVVRWRWRETGQVDSALVCRTCVHSYAHRKWDAVRRDWIT